jgi:hypothetical protein
LQFLKPDDRSAHWWDEFDRLTGGERDALAGLLLNIALRRRTVQRDFGAIHQLLEMAYALGLADTPAASQAAELWNVSPLFRVGPRRARSNRGAVLGCFVS